MRSSGKLPRFRGNVTAETPFKKTDGSRSLDYRRRAAEDKAHAAGSQIIRRLRELGQQALAGLWRQPVGDTGHDFGAPPSAALLVGQVSRAIGFFAPDCRKKLFDRHCRSEEHGPPAGGLSQSQKVYDPGDVGALAQRAGDDGFHSFFLVCEHINAARPPT